MAFSPDGAKLVSGSDDGTVRIWDAASGTELARLAGHTGRVLSVAFSPDGRRLASGSGDGTVRIWDASGGAEPVRLAGHTGAVRSVVFSPNGIRLARVAAVARVAVEVATPLVVVVLLVVVSHRGRRAEPQIDAGARPAGLTVVAKHVVS